EVLGRYGLTATAAHPQSRRLKVRGTIDALSTAFGTTLTLVSSPGPGGGTVTHRYRSGGLSVPAELSGIVTAVLGLDDRPQAPPHSRRPRTGAVPETGVPETAVPETAVPEGTVAPDAGPTPGPLTAPQVAGFYNFPAGTDGTGQTIAVIELGGGYTASDLD